MADVSVLATRYNNLQARIEAIYGNPTSSASVTGYGMTTRSFPVGPLVKNPKSFNAASSVNYTTNRITITSHVMLDRDRVEYDPNGNDPIIGNLVDDAHYWVKRIDANTIELYYDEAFTDPVDLLSGATGTHILRHLEGSLAQADSYFRLYLDLAAARVHQLGSGYTIPNSAIIAKGDNLLEQYITDLESLMNNVEQDRLIVESNQLSLENLADGTGTSINSTRTTAWNGSITHEFNVNFANSAQRTGFFNAGGEIRFTGSLTGGSGTKTADWRGMFTKAGTVTFDTGGTTTTGLGPGTTTTAVTPYTLNTSYQLLMQQNGATYAANRYYIYAKFVGTTTIRFLVEYADLDAGGSGLPGGTGGPNPIDENVNGTIRSNVAINRPNGSFVVGGTTYTSVNIPVTGLNVSTL